MSFSHYFQAFKKWRKWRGLIDLLKKFSLSTYMFVWEDCFPRRSGTGGQLVAVVQVTPSHYSGPYLLELGRSLKSQALVLQLTFQVHV